MIYLEKELDKLRILPKIEYNNDDLYQQRLTPASKMYREYLQQYTNIVKILTKELNKDDEDDKDSPLRRWVKINEQERLDNIDE